MEKFCSNCGSVRVDDAKFCTNCGAPFAADQPEQAEPVYSAPQPEPAQPVYSVPVYEQPAATSGSKVLANWKTSVGASIGGAVAGLAVSGFINSVGQMPNLSTGAAFAFLVFDVLYFVVCICYAATYYPALFKDDCKKTASSGAISFMNLFFGGIIFGCIWNSNLTKKKKGVSYIVFIVLVALGLLSSLGYAFIG